MRKLTRKYYLFNVFGHFALCCCFISKLSVCQGILDHDSNNLNDVLDYKHNSIQSFHNRSLSFQSQTTEIPASHLESSCKAFIDRYAVVAAGFTKCSIENARPLRFCEKCVKDFALAKSVYTEIMKGLAKDDRGDMCGQYILNADKIQLIGQTEAFIERVWSDGNCENCFDNFETVNDTVVYSVNNETNHFQDLANRTWDCFLNHSRASIRPFGPTGNVTNNTVCKDCKQLYHNINKFYVTLEDIYADSVCVDVVDMMNYTRMLWSGDFLCSNPKGDIAAVCILSGVFCALPIIFYAAAKIYGTKQEHRIIEQKRYRNNQTQDGGGTSGS